MPICLTQICAFIWQSCFCGKINRSLNRTTSSGFSPSQFLFHKNEFETLIEVHDMESCRCFMIFNADFAVCSHQVGAIRHQRHQQRSRFTHKTERNVDKTQPRILRTRVMLSNTPTSGGERHRRRRALFTLDAPCIAPYEVRFLFGRSTTLRNDRRYVAFWKHVLQLPNSTMQIFMHQNIHWKCKYTIFWTCKIHVNRVNN